MWITDVYTRLSDDKLLFTQGIRLKYKTGLMYILEINRINKARLNKTMQ